MAAQTPETYGTGTSVYRRNMALFFADYATYDIGISLMDFTTILPAFVDLMSGSEILVGISGLIFPLGWTLPQLFTAGPVARAARKKPWMLWPLVIGRLALISVALLIFIAPGRQWHDLLVGIFLIGVATFSTGNGISSLAWFDIVGRALTQKHRGKLFSFGQVTWAVGMLIAAPVSNYILGPAGPDFPRNYGVLFLIAGVLTLLEAGLLGAVHEPPPKRDDPPDRPTGNYLAYIGRLLREDTAYRRFLGTRLATDMSYMSLPFLIGFTMEYAGFEDETAIGLSLLAGAVTRVLAAIGMDRIYDKAGAKAVIIVMTLATAAGQAWGLGVSLGILPVNLSLVAYVLMIGSVAGFMIGYLNWLMDAYTAGRRTAYIGLTNTLSAISAVAPMLGGALLSVTDYPALFGVSLAFALAGVVGAFGLRNP